jgi:hypothetical protein
MWGACPRSVPRASRPAGRIVKESPNVDPRLGAWTRRGVDRDSAHRGRMRGDEAVLLSDLNVPGFNVHRLRGKLARHSLHVDGPWCVTFEWEDGDAVRVNLEQCH